MGVESMRIGQSMWLWYPIGRNGTEACVPYRNSRLIIQSEPWTPEEWEYNPYGCTQLVLVSENERSWMCRVEWLHDEPWKP